MRVNNLIIAQFLCLIMIGCDYRGELLYKIDDFASIVEYDGCECPSLILYDSNFDVEIVLYQEIASIKGNPSLFELCYTNDVYSCILLKRMPSGKYQEDPSGQIRGNLVEFDLQFADK